MSGGGQRRAPDPPAALKRGVRVGFDEIPADELYAMVPGDSEGRAVG